MKRRLSSVLLLAALAAALGVALGSRWDETLSRRTADVVFSRPGPESAVVRVTEGAAKLDVNRADAETLSLLPGLGGTLSQALVDYRAANGPFRSIDELLNVPGLGEGRLEALRALITCGEED